MTTGGWVFGYGSLVSPASFGSTLGRVLRPGVDFLEAELDGFGRRWNYGVLHTEGTTVEPDGRVRTWTIVALGVVPSECERVNGVVGRVEPAEMAALDRRERHYDRVDVTDLVSAPTAVSGPIVTYVPRPEPIRHAEVEGAAGRAAIEQRYWDLVDAAFAALGPDQRAAYHATTPGPGLPVVDLVRHPVV